MSGTICTEVAETALSEHELIDRDEIVARLANQLGMLSAATGRDERNTHLAAALVAAEPPVLWIADINNRSTDVQEFDSDPALLRSSISQVVWQFAAWACRPSGSRRRST